MMSLTFRLFTQVSGSGPLGPLVVLNMHSLQQQIQFTVKILKFGTPQTIAIIVLKIEMFDVTLH